MRGSIVKAACGQLGGVLESFRDMGTRHGNRDRRKAGGIAALMMRLVPRRLRRAVDLPAYDFWRAQLLTTLLRAAAWAGLPAFLVSLPLSIVEGEYALAAVIVAGYGVAIWLVLHPGYSYRARAMSFLAVVLLCAVTLVVRLGPVAAGDVWLFAYLLFATLLLGVRWWPLIIAPVLILFAVVAVLLNEGLMPWSASLESFLVVSVNFLAISAGAVASVSLLTIGLRVSLSRERRLVGRFRSQARRLSASVAELDRQNRSNLELLRELNHRVKNNLQILSSILSIHSGQDGDSDCSGGRAGVTAMKSRIHVLALVHDGYGLETNPGDVDLVALLGEVATVALSLEGRHCFVPIGAREPAPVRADLAVLIGLAVNELLLSADCDRPPSIRVESSPALCVDLADPGRDWTGALPLVEALVAQAAGRLELSDGRALLFFDT